MFFGEPFGGVITGPVGSVLAVLLRSGAPLTGREVHALVADRHSLWSVQEALKTLRALGIIEARAVGRAGLHSVNEQHYAVPHLRALLDPVAALTSVVNDVVGDTPATVLVFGSLARGESSRESDVDLAVIANDWDDRVALEDAVRNGLGNTCDVIVFAPEEFETLARSGEPVVLDILRDGIALVGTKPRVAGAA